MFCSHSQLLLDRHILVYGYVDVYTRYLGVTLTSCRELMWGLVCCRRNQRFVAAGSCVNYAVLVLADSFKTTREAKEGHLCIYNSRPPPLKRFDCFHRLDSRLLAAA